MSTRMHAHFSAASGFLAAALRGGRLWLLNPKALELADYCDAPLH